jgi:ABC-2 type transport system permease protein
VRGGLLEGAPTSELLPHVWLLLAMGIVLIPVGVLVFGQAERYAKRTGKLKRSG